jgi:NAD(P)-dependent dehydrogenase (short-subunit alcohol dehydrogenase family)
VGLDLTSFASIRACAAELATRTPEIDVLINNAGLILSTRQLTEDGFETTFGTNHLGHFLLTSELEAQIKAATAPRVVNVASIAHAFAIGGLNFDNLQMERRYNMWVAYGRSKLANIYFTQELARRWAADGVVVQAVHPGSVNSHFGSDGDTRGVMGWALNHLGPLVMVTPEEGARASVFLATAPEGAQSSGTYWTKQRKGRLMPWAKRPRDAARLWDVSEQYVADGHP